MRNLVFKGTRWAAIGLGGLLVQDYFHGLDLRHAGRLVVVVLLAVSAVVLIVTWQPVWQRLARGPLIEVGEITEYYRSAVASQRPNDLQVVYARVGNMRDGGGASATAESVEAEMELLDGQGQSVSHCKGTWLDLTAHDPDPALSRRTVTLKPTKEKWGLEIAGKFSWGAQAWLGGETAPSLQPGTTYIVRASIGDGKRKALIAEWAVENPGADQPLKVRRR